MSREGAATEIWYVAVGKSVPVLQAAVTRKGFDAKVLCITDLVEAFAEGAIAFGEELQQDQARRDVVSDRIRLWLGFMPTTAVVEAWNSEK
jgi:hypothetical protein